MQFQSRFVPSSTRSWAETRAYGSQIDVIQYPSTAGLRPKTQNELTKGIGSVGSTPICVSHEMHMLVKPHHRGCELASTKLRGCSNINWTFDCVHLEYHYWEKRG